MFSLSEVENITNASNVRYQRTGLYVFAKREHRYNSKNLCVCLWGSHNCTCTTSLHCTTLPLHCDPHRTAIPHFSATTISTTLLPLARFPGAKMQHSLQHECSSRASLYGPSLHFPPFPTTVLLPVGLTPQAFLSSLSATCPLPGQNARLFVMKTNCIQTAVVRFSLHSAEGKPGAQAEGRQGAPGGGDRGPGAQGGAHGLHAETGESPQEGENQ